MESIRILQDTYEKLYAITAPLGDVLDLDIYTEYRNGEKCKQ